MEASGNIDNLTCTELLKVEELIHGMHYGSITIVSENASEYERISTAISLYAYNVKKCAR